MKATSFTARRSRSASGPLETRTGRAVRVFNSDLAVFETPENRTDLDCEVSPVKPQLAFDMRFYAGYLVRIPLKDVAGGGNQLRVLVRITPLDREDSEYYLVDRFTVPRTSVVRHTD